MRVSIDCTPLLIRSAGVKTYLYHWTEALRRLAGREAVQLFPFLDTPGALNHEATVISRHATTARILFLHFSNLRGNPVLDWLSSGIDLFHASNQVRNPPRNRKLTTTLHDLTCWVMPEMHRAATVAGDKRFARQIVGRADGVIAISESTRRDAIEHLRLAPEKIEVIYSGVSEPFFNTRPEGVDAVKRKYGLAKPYLLFVSTIEPRKNVDGLLDAYEGLGDELRREFELVLVGSIGWAAPATIARLQSPPPSVRYLGYVPEEDLPSLTAGAAVCVYPSFYEGFGLPVAQALAAGVPVLTSHVSSLPEVAGEAAVYVDPRSTGDIRDGIRKLLLSATLREKLAVAARRRGPRFRWDETARQSWRFFEKVCGER
jgi:glycosyltransferase involved in cell wall biosynthesis